MEGSTAAGGRQSVDDSPSAQSSDARLKSSSALILGLVRGGFTSGYAIKGAIDGMRTGRFWATTFAQIYPVLAQLEGDGLLERRDDPAGRRPRSAYALTPAGGEAFFGWLRAQQLPEMELRDEGLLRLGFIDHLAPEDRGALLDRLRERAERSEREFREQIVPMAEAAREHGWDGPLMVARMGAEYHAWAAAYFAGLTAEAARGGDHVDSA